MPSLKQYNIFISHSWNYSGDYKRLVDLLEAYPLFRFYNFSISRDKDLTPHILIPDRELKERLTAQIARSSAVIVIAGMWYNHSVWIQYEVSEALRMKKPIISVRPYGYQRMPADLQSMSTAVVGWSSGSIVETLRNLCR